MANKVVIEVTARFVDTGEKNVEKLSAAIDKAQGKADKLGKTSVKSKFDADTTAFDSKYDSVEKKANRLGRQKALAVLDAMDNASKKIAEVTSKAERLAGKAYRATITAIDNASKVIGGISSAAKGLASGAYNVTIGVIDKVTAPVRGLIGKLNSVLGLAGAGLSAYGLIFKPVELQVDYENLTTTFDVLLGGADAAEKRIEELTAFAGKTPFTRDEIYTSNRILEVYSKGAISTDLEGRGGMKMVGDIAAGVNTDYESVAKWIGRLYSAMKSGDAVGQMTSALQDMGALDSTDRAKIENLSDSVKSGAIDIGEAWEGVADVFDRFDGIMEKQSDKLGNLLLGVKSFVTNNFLKKIGAGLSDGISPFLQKFRTWRGENKDLIANWGQQVQAFATDVSTKAVTSVERLASKVSGVMSSDQWKGADGFGKIAIVWDEVISKPFGNWWDTKGKDYITGKFRSLGSDIGKATSKGLMFLLGINVNSAIDDGASMGSAFFQGFKENFNTEAVSRSLKDAISNLPSVARNLWGKGKSIFSELKVAWKEVIADPFAEWWYTGGKEMFVSGAAKAGTWLGEGITSGVKFLSKGIMALFGVESDGVFSEAADVGESFWNGFMDSFDGAAITDAIVDAIGAVWGALPGWAKMLIGGYGTAKLASGISPIISAGKTVVGAIGSATKGTGILGFGSNAAIALGGGNLSATASMGAGSLSALGLGAVGSGVIGGVTIISGLGDIIKGSQMEGKEGDYNVWKGGTKIVGTGSGAALGAAIGSIIPGIGTAIGALLGAGIGGITSWLSSDAIAKWGSGYEEPAESAEEFAERMRGLEYATEGYSEASKKAIMQTKLTGEQFLNLKKTKLDEWFGDVALTASEASEVAKTAFKNIVGEDSIRKVNEFRTSIERVDSVYASMESAWNTSKQISWKIQAGIELMDGDEASYVSAVESYIKNAEEFLNEKQYSVRLAMNLILGTTSNEDSSAVENPLVGEMSSYYTDLQSQVADLKGKVYKIIEDSWNNDTGNYELTLNSTKMIDEIMEEISNVMERANAAKMEAQQETLKVKYGGIDYDFNTDQIIASEMNALREDRLAANYEAFEISMGYLIQARDDPQNDTVTLSNFEEKKQELVDKLEQSNLSVNQEIDDFTLELTRNAHSKAANEGIAIFDEIMEEFNNGLSQMNDPSTYFATLKRYFESGQDIGPLWDDFIKNFNLSELAEKASGILGGLQETAKMFEDANVPIPESLQKGIDAATEALDFATSGDALWEKVAQIAEAAGFENARDSLLEAGKLMPESVGDGILEGNTDKIDNGVRDVWDYVDNATQNAFSTPFDVTAKINITYEMNSLNSPTIEGPQQPSFNVGKHALGGFPTGKQLTWINEEGPEAIIPLVPERRARGLDLWYETGRRLGVLENANGGIYGGGYSEFSVPQYSTPTVQGGNATIIHVDSGAVHIEVKAADGQSVTDVIEENLEPIAEKVVGVIVKKVEPVFKNTPVTVSG